MLIQYISILIVSYPNTQILQNNNNKVQSIELKKSTDRNMMKKPPGEKDKVVQLQELVSQPQCLKLLILHTPFTLNLNSLPLCINLVKLDLSRNNLTSFPYLGDMPNLKFIFIHENKLDIDSLIGIFEEDLGKQSKSPLSKSIIWVTYWGNKNQFNARHYLANHTCALAVDHHMIVAEQKNQSIIVNNNCIQPFDPVTNVSEIFHNRKKFNKNATEQEYMAQFWQDMAEIRKKQILINPVIRIQKCFRGWIYRITKVREKERQKQCKQILQKFFRAWKVETTFSKKIKRIFKAKNKQYLLYPIKEMQAEEARRKIAQYCQKIRQQVLMKKLNFVKQLNFFNLLRANCKTLKCLYRSLNVEESKYIMVHQQAYQQFQKYVIPFVKRLNKSRNNDIITEENRIVMLRYLYEKNQNQKQLVRLLKLNEKSVVIQAPQNNNNEKKLNYSICKCEADLSRIFSIKNVHFSILDIQKMNKIQKQFALKDKLNLSELKKVSGNKEVLMDIIRGVYFYNTGYLTKSKIPTKKINILSQYCIKKISYVIKIQKAWKGVRLRRKLSQILKDIYTRQRAAIKIQRWIRNLSVKHRHYFILNMIEYLNTFNSEYFYIKVQDYKRIINKQTQNHNKNKVLVSFPEQNVGVFIKKQNGKLILSWDYECEEKKNIKMNHMIGKKLFEKHFSKKIFENEEILENIRFGEENKYEKGLISHLFHYRTQVALFTKKDNKYLQIKCTSKYDCRFRILGLKLLTYQFNSKQKLSIFPKEYINLTQVQENKKKNITNNNSIFIYQNSSHYQIQTDPNSKAHTHEYVSKFYINSEENQKPIKYQTNLKIIIIDSKEKEVNENYTPNKPIRSISHNQKFDVSHFLISQVNQIALNQKIRQEKIQKPVVNIKQNSRRKESIKNFKLQKKIKLKNRDKGHTMHNSQLNQKFNFMLDNPHINGRLSTQPDLQTFERSLGSIAPEPEQREKKQEVKHTRKRIQSLKSNSKDLDCFTKNFINQGNFIQNQFLYGQIKRLKSQGERHSYERAQRVKTQENERQQILARVKEEKINRAQVAHKKHKQEMFRSMIEKKASLQNLPNRSIRKSEQRDVNYRSMPKRMRINFAEECYPIVGKRPVDQST